MQFKRYFDTCDPMDVPIKVWGLIFLLNEWKYCILSNSLGRIFWYLLMVSLILICVNQTSISRTMMTEEVHVYYHFGHMPINRQMRCWLDLISLISVSIMCVTVLYIIYRLSLFSMPFHQLILRIIAKYSKAQVDFLRKDMQ